MKKIKFMILLLLVSTSTVSAMNFGLLQRGLKNLENELKVLASNLGKLSSEVPTPPLAPPLPNHQFLFFADPRNDTYLEEIAKNLINETNTNIEWQKIDDPKRTGKYPLFVIVDAPIEETVKSQLQEKKEGEIFVIAIYEQGLEMNLPRNLSTHKRNDLKKIKDDIRNIESLFYIFVDPFDLKKIQNWKINRDEIKRLSDQLKK